MTALIQGWKMTTTFTAKVSDGSLSVGSESLGTPNAAIRLCLDGPIVKLVNRRKND